MQQKGDDFRALKIVHLALLGSLTLFTIIVLGVRFTGPKEMDQDKQLEQVLQVVTVVLSLGSLLFGYNIFKKKIAEARNSPGPAEKRMELYRAACIMWWAMIEGPGLLSIIGFFLTGNFAFFALALFHSGLLAMFMPRKENIILLLNLTSDEVARLEGKL